MTASEAELSDLENELVRLIRFEFKKLRDKDKDKPMQQQKELVMKLVSQPWEVKKDTEVKFNK